MGKGFWKDYFSFSKHERTAVLVLLFIIVVFIFLPGFFAPKLHNIVVDSDLQRRLDSVTLLAEKEAGNEHLPTTNEVSTQQSSLQLTLFRFDPNTLSADGFKQIGLNDKTIRTIINYRKKGGVFRKPEDIRKIYGLSSVEADQLIPYIQIAGNEIAVKKESVSGQTPDAATQKQYRKIDINTATEEEWKELPGIGNVLSKRVVKFRNAIGGFKTIEDVRKTYGLSDSTYQMILPYLTISENNSPGN